ncbi:sunset domain-containing protein [Carnobacterium mobile]|uniref:sunset domain-containing protein n=1 Tax=Carnobacterium mobile TaxID=2750 RepID=UPI001FD21CE1|nr:hypothetical protein [Carnobacterium mobile]
MKNWKVIIWLCVFYPAGIYFMFKYTKWKKGIKYTITAFLSIIAGIIVASGELFFSLVISGMFIFLIGLISIVKSVVNKGSKKVPFAILFVGILLFGFSIPQVESQEAERVAIEQQQQKEEQKEQEKKEKEKQLAQLKEATVAVEAVEQDKNRENYDKAYTLVAALALEDEGLTKRLKVIDTYLIKEEKTKEATLAVEAAEENKTRENYDKAFSIVSSIDLEDSDLDARLAEVEKFVVSEEDKNEKAVAALEKVKSDKNRDSYNAASTLISALAVKNTNLTYRLKEVDKVISAEETRIATEKAKEAEEAQKAEEELVAEENKKATKEAEQREQAKNENPTTSSAGSYVDAQVNGLIKGSSSGIYHVPGSTYYDRTTNPVAYFTSIEEAQAAGYRAPLR